MTLSDAIEINEGTVKISICGNYVACGWKNTLRIFDVQSTQIVSSFSCTGRIKTLDWHNDSDHVLCVLDKVHKVQAFSLLDSEWICTIEGGEIGVETAAWSPKGYSILTLAEFNVRISIWSLTGHSLVCIDNPILKKKDNFSFSVNGNYFAVIIGPLEKYKLLIFSTMSWTLIQEVQCTLDVNVPSNPVWSPSDLHLVIWETVDVRTAFLEIYSLSRSKLIGTFKKSEQICRICNVLWIPSGQFLLVGCHNEQVYVLNHITWNVLTTLSNPQVINKEICDIYEESSGKLTSVKCRPVLLSKLKRSDNTALPIVSISCDCSGRFISIQCGSMPAVVNIWEVGSFSLRAVVILQKAVTDLKWNFRESNLLISSKGSSVILWKPSKPIKIHVDDDMCVETCFSCHGDSRNICMVSNSCLYMAQDLLNDNSHLRVNGKRHTHRVLELHNKSVTTSF